MSKVPLAEIARELDAVKQERDFLRNAPVHSTGQRNSASNRAAGVCASARALRVASRATSRSAVQ